MFSAQIYVFYVDVVIVFNWRWCRFVSAKKQIAKFSWRLKQISWFLKDIPINNTETTPDPTETFNEIGDPLMRTKRQVAFPDDEVTQNEETETVERIGDDEDSIHVVAAADGRALKQTTQTVTKIDVGIQSQLLVAPGSTSIIYFDVTNLRNEPTYHSFNVQDEKRFLRALEPRLWVWKP
jgi:hypothetical protein